MLSLAVNDEIGTVNDEDVVGRENDEMTGLVVSEEVIQALLYI
jgi:hypothetical protein